MRLEADTEPLKETLNKNTVFKMEVVNSWGRPQNFIDSFVGNHGQLMDFILALYKKTQTKI
jgi:hypothetical protein